MNKKNQTKMKIFAFKKILFHCQTSFVTKQGIYEITSQKEKKSIEKFIKLHKMQQILDAVYLTNELDTRSFTNFETYKIFLIDFNNIKEISQTNDFIKEKDKLEIKQGLMKKN